MSEESQTLESLLEALEKQKELADQNPKEHLPALADTYGELGRLYRSIGEAVNAREHTGQSLYLLALLAAQMPAEYGPKLDQAMSQGAALLGSLDTDQRGEWLGGIWNAVLQTIRWQVVPVAGPLAGLFLYAGLTELALEPFLFARQVLLRVGADGAESYDGPIAEIAAALGPERTAALQAELDEKFAPLLESLPA
jgi:hypothetical protein